MILLSNARTQVEKPKTISPVLNTLNLKSYYHSTHKVILEQESVLRRGGCYREKSGSIACVRRTKQKRLPRKRFQAKQDTGAQVSSDQTFNAQTSSSWFL